MIRESNRLTRINYKHLAHGVEIFRNLHKVSLLRDRMNNGKLYLIPNIIADDTQEEVIPSHVRNTLGGIRHFLAEDVRTARRFLSSLKIYESIESLHFEVLNKETPAEALKSLMDPIRDGHSVGIISESGCPGIADPGALAVRFAHENAIQVIPLVGPSSILLALMASGLNGQHFAFHGYLPIESKEASQVIKTFEKESKTKNQTQVFIETPYRNNSLLNVLLKTLHDETLLCVAMDVTGKTESINTHAVKKWRSLKPSLPKTPVVFLFLAT
jgi:16S rRNA (cytidine1402-2'-O)-methyltransferase